MLCPILVTPLDLSPTGSSLSPTGSFSCWETPSKNTKSESESRSSVSATLWPRGLPSPWNSPGQNTEVGSCSLLQGIFPTQGLNPGLPNCRQILHCLEWVDISFSRRAFWSRDWTHVSCIAGRVFTTEPPGKSYLIK